MEKDIKKFIDTDIVKKIFGNTSNIKEYLLLFGFDKKDISKLSTQELYEKVVRQWDYNKSLKTIRELFKKTDKYKQGKDSSESIGILLQEWKDLGFGEISWPFSQGQFDNFVQSINSENITRTKKDEKVKTSAVKYRRIKEINTTRNDFLETLIFEKNENIIPTLSHSKGVDFFIDGISYDQKVAKSPTNQFKIDFGENWKNEAINNPLKVAEYLYKYQDEGRFGYSPRLYIVYIDEEIKPVDIQKRINEINLNNPLEITFTYKHKDLGNKTYKTQAFVILFYKN